MRLHTGDFDFGNVKENGGDLRFVADDDKTPLKYHIEKFDPINEMALVWVQVPKLTPGKADTIWMYSGNSKATPADDAKATYDASQIAVYHFDGTEAVPQDRSGNGNNAAQSTAKLGDGSLIGRGATFDGGSTITIPASPTLKLVAAQGYTVSAWIKTAVVQNNAVLFQQQDGAKSISLSILGGKLVAAVGATETPRTMDVKPGTWHHVAMTAGQTLTVYLDGLEIAQAPITLADMQGEVTVGKGFVGEMDELEVAGVARPADWIKVAAEGQGSDALLLGYGQDEASGGGGGTSYFGTILHSVTLDGWVVIGILFVMAVISWVVMGLKAVVIGKVQKGNKAFLRDYSNLSVTETAKLDQEESEEDAEIEGSQLLIALYGKHDHYQDSTLYRIYHTGMQEIKNRFGKADVKDQYLSPQAIGSIKASLDATLVRENQKLSSLMVLLTIAISGGPFLGSAGYGGGRDDHLCCDSGDRRRQRGGNRARYRGGAGGNGGGSGGRDPGFVRLQLSGQRDQNHFCRYAYLRRRVHQPNHRSVFALGDDYESPGRQRTVRRYQHHAHAGSGVCVADHFHHHDHGFGAGHQGQPAAGQQVAGLGKPKTKAITIAEDGKIYLDTYPVTFAELETRLRAYSAETPDLPVIIKGDAKVQYEKVIDVMDLLGRLDITHLGLVTQKSAK